MAFISGSIRISCLLNKSIYPLYRFFVFQQAVLPFRMLSAMKRGFFEPKGPRLLVTIKKFWNVVRCNWLVSIITDDTHEVNSNIPVSEIRLFHSSQFIFSFNLLIVYVFQGSVIPQSLFMQFEISFRDFF